MSYVERLARLAIDPSLERITPDERARLRSILLYNLAMARAGWTPGDAFDRTVAALGEGSGGARQLVTDRRLPPAQAAYATAALVCARGQNDTYLPAKGHIGCVVVPAVLAAAEAHGASGATVLAALAAGCETIGRVARPVAAAVVGRGLRATSVFGVFGAAAGAARAMSLTEDQTAHALALAANAAAGTMQCWAEGTPEWRLQVAGASRAGVEAAILAEAGFTAASAALEGPAGFYAAFAGSVPSLDEGTGVVSDLLFKPLPGCAINQGAVLALLDLLSDAPNLREQVVRIEVRMAPADAAYPGIALNGPFDGPSGAMMSLSFMLAAALHDGTVRRRHFDEEHASPDLAAIGQRVDLHADPNLSPGTSRVTCVLGDGHRLKATSDDRERLRFDEARTRALVTDLAEEVGHSVDDLTAAVDALEGSSTIAALLAACAVPPTAGACRHVR